MSHKIHLETNGAEGEVAGAGQSDPVRWRLGLQARLEPCKRVSGRVLWKNLIIFPRNFSFSLSLYDRVRIRGTRVHYVGLRIRGRPSER